MTRSKAPHARFTLRLLFYTWALATVVPALADASAEEVLPLFLWTLLPGTAAVLLCLLLLPRLPSAMARARENRWVRRADLAAFSLLSAALLLEGVLLAGQALRPGYVLWDEAPDAMRVATLRGEESNPYFEYHWNSLGFHDDEFFAARPGDHTVALLADSFGVGIVPFAYNFATVAERRLTALLKGAVPGRVAVHNLGVTRIGMPGYAYLLRTEVPRLGVAQVVLAVFAGNDLDGFPEARPRHGFLKMRLSLGGWLLWRVPRRAWKIHRALEARGAEEPSVPLNGQAPLAYLNNPELEQPFFDEEHFLAIERGKMALLDPADLTTKGKYERFFGALEKFHRELDRRLLVMLIPDELQVNDRLWRQLGGGTAATARLQRDYPQRRITAWCAEERIRVLDLLPVLRRAERGGRTYHLRDTHFNARGNRVAGEALAETLAQFQLDSLK